MKKQIILSALVVAALFQVSPQASANSATDHAIIGGIIGGVIGGAIAHDQDRRDDRRDDRRGDWDRGDHWGHGPGRFPPGRGPGRPYPPQRPPQQAQASVQINGVTRQAGGEWYRLNLRQPLQVSNIDISVLRANVRIHEAAVVTDRQQRIPLYDLSNGQVLGTGAYIGTFVNSYDRIMAIDIRVESFGDYADLGVAVTSPEGYPVIDVTRF
jgi:hypothetical protein